MERATIDAAARRECPVAETCAGCEAEPNPNLFATCIEGACAAIDVRANGSLSSCSANADCVLTARDCCNCDPHHVTLRAGAEREYYRLTCGESPIGSPCEPHDVPAWLTGSCGADGHC